MLSDEYANVTGGVEILTPAQAEKDLQVMASAQFNRKFTPSRVDYYARIMADGGWMMTGQPGIFDEDGVLVDGQHRWRACLTSGVEVPIYVVRGVKHSVFPALDDVKARKLPCLLSCAYKTNGGIKLAPHPRPVALARVITLAHEVEDLQGKRALPRGTALSHERWTAGEYQQWYADEHPGIADAHAFIASFKGVKGGVTGPLAAVFYWLSKVDLEEARNLVTAYTRGEVKGEDGTTDKLYSDHPAIALREQFMLASRRGSPTKISQRQKCASLIMLWNSLLTGVAPKKTVWGHGLKSELVYPVIETGGLIGG